MVHKAFSRWFTGLLVLMLCVPGALLAQRNGAFATADKSIAAGLNSGSAGDVTRYFGQITDLTAGTSRNACSKAQGTVILSDFFSRHPSRGFSAERTASSGGGYFTIGTLRTASGNFRVYYSLRQAGGDIVMQELRLEQ